MHATGTYSAMSIVRPYRTWDPQYRTGHPCTRTSSVQYFLIRYLDPKVEEMRVEK
jgi:hypothetical protein